MTYRKQELVARGDRQGVGEQGKGGASCSSSHGWGAFLRKGHRRDNQDIHKNTGVRNVGSRQRQHDGTHGVDREGPVRVVPALASTSTCRSTASARCTTRSGSSPASSSGRSSLQGLRDIEKHYKNFSVQVETTVSKHNEDVLIENYDWFRKNLDVDTVFHVAHPRQPKEPCPKFFNVESTSGTRPQWSGMYKSGSLSGYDHFPFADFINASGSWPPADREDRAHERVPDPLLSAGTSVGRCSPTANVYRRAADRPTSSANVRDAGYDFRRLVSRERTASGRWHPRVEVLLHLRCFLTYILFNPRMMPAVLKEWSSLKLRKAWRRVTGPAPPPRSRPARARSPPSAPRSPADRRLASATRAARGGVRATR